MFRAGNPCCPRILILSYSLQAWPPLSIKLVYAIWPAEFITSKPEVAYRACLELGPWLVPLPLSRAKYCSPQGRGFIIFCVALGTLGPPDFVDSAILRQRVFCSGHRRWVTLVQNAEFNSGEMCTMHKKAHIRCISTVYL